MKKKEIFKAGLAEMIKRLYADVIVYGYMPDLIFKDFVELTRFNDINDNVDSTSKVFPISNGLFGKKVKSNGVRQIDAPDQYKAAEKFYDKIAYGGVEKNLSNGKGKITKMKDTTTIVYREFTSTANSPCVEITITSPSIGNTKVKTQKIHFEGDKRK